ncbi:MAG TPA: ABC transporter permease [Planctomycetota bacterium]|nr:ABC transporter permease [Planctomycetota bacterium]
MRTLVRAIRIGIKDLWLHGLRSFLTVLGVVFGVFSVVTMLAVGEGASAQALERIRRLGSNNIMLTAKKAVEDETQGQARRMAVYGLTYDDETRLRECFPTVRRIVPAKIVRKEARVGERSLEVRVVGTTPEWFELVPRRMLAGRELTEADLARHATVCVLTEAGARKLLATERSVGSFVRVAGVSFEVVGIVESEVGKVEGLATPDQEVDAYIPMTVCRDRFGDISQRRVSGSFERENVELHQVIVEVDDTADVEPTAGAILAMLKRFHKREDYKVDVPLTLLREAEATKRTFNIVLGSIAAISLLVGGIGIMNIMLASVTERTREIGIRRAIGAKKRQIIGQFLIESVVLSFVGGIVGLFFGVTSPALIQYFSGMPTVVTPFSILLALGISCTVGIVFGIYPARRAADLDPIVALRHE